MFLQVQMDTICFFHICLLLGEEEEKNTGKIGTVKGAVNDLIHFANLQT